MLYEVITHGTVELEEGFEPIVTVNDEQDQYCMYDGMSNDLCKSEYGCRKDKYTRKQERRESIQKSNYECPSKSKLNEGADQNKMFNRNNFV